MKKQNVLFSFVALFCWLLSPQIVQATEYYVNPGDDLDQIARSIPAGEHVLHIAAGTYIIDQNLTIAEGLEVVGAGVGQTIITGTGGYGYGFRLQSNFDNTLGNKIHGITIQGTDELIIGISVEKRHNVEIYNCEFKDLFEAGLQVRGNYYDGEKGKDHNEIDWIYGTIIHDNYFEHCGHASFNIDGDGCYNFGFSVGAAVSLSSNDGTEFYNNHIKNLAHTDGGGLKSFFGGGFGRYIKVYNNIFDVTDHWLDPDECGTSVWKASPAVEVGSWMECEIYNNYMGSWTSFVYSGTEYYPQYSYSHHIHHNTWEYGDSANAGEAIEPSGDMIIHDNVFKNLRSSVIGSNNQHGDTDVGKPYPAATNVQFYRNIVTGNPDKIETNAIFRIQGTNYFKNWKVYNNTFKDFRCVIVSMVESTKNYKDRSGFHFANNIFYNVNTLTQTAYTKGTGTWVEAPVFENNIMYDWEEPLQTNWTPDEYGDPGNMDVTLINNLGMDAAPGVNPGLQLTGDMPSPYFRPEDENSAVVNAGIVIPGYTDYAIGLPDVGKYEYSSTPIHTLTAFSSKGGSVNPNGSVEVQQGTMIKVVAIPNEGYAFDKWNENGSTNDTITITVNSDTTLTALFKVKTYTLSTGVSPAGVGAVSVTPNLANYAHGTKVILVAFKTAGYLFNGWNIPGQTNDTLTLTMSKNMEVMANFTASPSAEARFEAEHAAISGATISNYASASNEQYVDCNGNSKITWDYNAASAANYGLQFSVASFSGTRALGLFVNDVKIGVVSTVSPRTAFEEISFSGVTLNAGSNTIELRDSEGTSEPDVDYMEVIGGPLPTTFTLITIAGTGGVVLPEGSNTYYPDDTIKINVVPQTGYYFTGWNGIGETNASISVLMSKDTSFSATFAPMSFSLSLSAGAGGTVNPSGDSVNTYGSVVQVIAIPDEGFVFDGWTGSSEINDTIEVTLTEDKSLTANFIAAAYTLTASASTGGSISLSPYASTYTLGSKVSATAIPDDGYLFTGWSGDLSGTTNPDTIIMNNDKRIKALFRSVPEYQITLIAGIGGSISPIGTFIYDSAATLEVVAIPSTGYEFSYWTGSDETNDTISLTVDKGITLIANFTAQTTTINRRNMVYFAIYPNPVKNGVLYLDTKAQPEIIDLTITDVKGNIVLKEKWQVGMPIHIEHLNAGIYYISLRTDHKIYLNKLIVE